MAATSKFKIDLNHSFDHLPNAPIVEAVLHWRTAAERKWEPDKLAEELKTRLPGYPEPKQQHEVMMGGKVGSDESAVQVQRIWHGVRLESADKLHIAQLRRDGLVFSRLKPYPTWVDFEGEALKLWAIYCDLFEPSQLERLSTRFINRIEPVTIAELDNYLAVPPKSSVNVPISEFLQQYTFEVPGYPYKARVVAALQPESRPDATLPGLILDVDVMTTKPYSIPQENLDTQLADLRWLKNKLFFESLTPAAIQQFKANP